MTDMKQVKVDNWGIFFLQRLQQFFNKTDYCDLTLQFENNVQLKVHRLVMNACTEYFHAKENTCEVIDDSLVMPISIDPDVIVPIVNFMYTGQLEFQMSNFDKLYETARIMNMTILTKLLDAQKVPASPLPKPTNKRGHVTPVTWNLQGKKIIPKTMDPDLPEPLPGRKLPVWKRKSAPNITARFTEDIRSVIEPVSMVYRPLPVKRNIDNTPRPTRFEWPEEDGTTTFESSFDDISYGSQPLITPTREENTSTSSSAFEEIRRNVSSVRLPVDDSQEIKRVNFDEVKEYLQEHRLRTDYILKDDDSNEEDGNDDSNDSQNRAVEETPVKRVRFEEKENVTKPRILGTKAAPKGYKDVSNHAKIISEVLKKYPHLVKKNKNIKLKIMQKDKSAKEPVPNSVSEVSYVLKKPKDSFTHGTPTGPWACVKCLEDVEYSVYADYRKHLLKKHPSSIDPLVCEECGLKTKKRNLLAYHMYTQHDIKLPLEYNFPRCKQCDYVALSEIFLRKHQESHTISYKCVACDENFSPYMKFIKHCYQQDHYENMNFECLYCTKRFVQPANLISHMRKYHSAEGAKDGLNEVSDTESNDEPISEKVKILSNIKYDSTKGLEMLMSKEMDERVASEETHVQVLDPSSEAEALNSVASGIAASLGLVDTIVVLDENQFVLHSTEEISTQDQNNEFILPEMVHEMTNINSTCLLTPQTSNPFKEITVNTQNTIISTSTENITSTDELVMVLTDHDYDNDNENRIISSENSNIVVLYSHPVEGQPTQYISRQGNIILDPQTGMIEMNGNKLHVANAEAINQGETIEMIQQEIEQATKSVLDTTSISAANENSTDIVTELKDFNEESTVIAEKVTEIEKSENPEMSSTTDTVLNISETDLKTRTELNISESDLNTETSLDLTESDLNTEPNLNIPVNNLHAENDLNISENVLNTSDLKTDSSTIHTKSSSNTVDILNNDLISRSDLPISESSNIQDEFNGDNELNTNVDTMEKQPYMKTDVDMDTQSQEKQSDVDLTEDNNFTEKNLLNDNNLNNSENESTLNKEMSIENQNLNVNMDTESTPVGDENVETETNLEEKEHDSNDSNSLDNKQEWNSEPEKTSLDETEIDCTKDESNSEKSQSNEPKDQFENDKCNIEAMEIDETPNDNENLSETVNINEGNSSEKEQISENITDNIEILNDEANNETNIPNKENVLPYEEPMEIDGKNPNNDKNSDSNEKQSQTTENSDQNNTPAKVSREKTESNVTALVSDWCDDDSGPQAADTETLRAVNTEPETDSKRLDTKIFANPKITKLLDDWDDGDTDSQHSAVDHSQKQSEKNQINTLIDDWEDDE